LGFKGLGTLTNGVYMTVTIQFVAEFFDSKRQTPGFSSRPVPSLELDDAVNRIRKAKQQSKVPSSDDIEVVRRHQQFRTDWEIYLAAQKVKEQPAPERLVV